MDENNQVPMEKCEVCGQEFSTETELDLHMQDKHPQEYRMLNQSPS